MDNRDYEILQRIEITQSDMQRKLSDLPCAVNCYKISILQKVVYGAVGIVLAAFMVSIISNPNTDLNKKSRRNTNVSSQNQQRVEARKNWDGRIINVSNTTDYRCLGETADN